MGALKIEKKTTRIVVPRAAPGVDLRMTLDASQLPLPPLEIAHQAKGKHLRLRPPGPGDMGWVVHRHGALYAAEYGWDWTFEALVAQVVSEFVLKHNPARERCWMAELDGRVVGSAFVVEKSAEIAKLRLVYVEPDARGLGISRHLLDASLVFARATGYAKMMLWTNRNLLAARGLYASAGFVMTLEEPYHGFGHNLVGETWECDLT
jgi:GNAT superfamily N-acetyltransferase